MKKCFENHLLTVLKLNSKALLYHIHVPLHYLILSKVNLLLQTVHHLLSLPYSPSPLPAMTFPTGILSVLSSACLNPSLSFEA